jgi:ligand-binding sensor domain-containing protein
VDNNNIKWFLTEAGLVSFDGNKWSIHNKNKSVPNKDLKDFVYDSALSGQKIWIASREGVITTSLPVEKKTVVSRYNTGNTSILSNNVLSVALGKNTLRWFGTDKGISAFSNDKWLLNSYQRKYKESMFKEFPVTSMATSPSGDTLYVGTEGAGVARVFRNNVDVISGASEYAQWGPIDLPSDKIYSICITSDGTQWFGTDMGVSRHTGNLTLRNWSVFNTSNGLINNFVRTIAVDKKGNIWFGTKGGISVYDGSDWSSYTVTDGLNSNNILCITIDKNGIVWIGTDDGVVSYNKGEFVKFR